MALNYVTLILDLLDGTGAPVSGGTATLSPNTQTTDTVDNVIIAQSPIVVPFRATGIPTIKILATDNSNLSPSGWAWNIVFTNVPGSPLPFAFFLPFSGGATQYLSSLTPLGVIPNVSPFMLEPSGTPTVGAVPVCTGASGATVWTIVGASVASVFGRIGTVIAQTGDYTASQVGAPASTSDHSSIASANPTVANWSNNSKKITSLANGSASSDAAAFGQIPVTDSTTADIQPSPGTAAAGSTTKFADAGHVHGQPSLFAPTGLTGATAASRYVGATASGAPGSGTFAVGDYVIDQTGKIFVCTGAGTPGTWTAVSGAGALGVWQPSFNGFVAATMDLDIGASNNNGSVGSAFALGQLFLTKLSVPVSVTFSTVWAVQVVAAGTPTYMAAGVYNSSGTLLQSTADQHATGWTAFQTGVALGGSVTVNPGSPVWIGFLVAGSGAAGTLVGNPTSSAAIYNLNLATASSRAGKTGAGLSTLPASFTPGSMTTFSVGITWVGLS